MLESDEFLLWNPIVMEIWRCENTYFSPKCSTTWDDASPTHIASVIQDTPRDARSCTHTYTQCRDRDRRCLRRARMRARSRTRARHDQETRLAQATGHAIGTAHGATTAQPQSAPQNALALARMHRQGRRSLSGEAQDARCLRRVQSRPGAFGLSDPGVRPDGRIIFVAHVATHLCTPDVKCHMRLQSTASSWRSKRGQRGERKGVSRRDTSYK